MATLKKTVRQSAHFWCLLQFLIWLCGPKLSQYWLLLVLSRGRLKMNGDVSGFWGCLKHPGIFWVVNASYPEEMGLGRIQCPRALSSAPALSKRELPICSSPPANPRLPYTSIHSCRRLHLRTETVMRTEPITNHVTFEFALLPGLLLYLLTTFTYYISSVIFKFSTIYSESYLLLNFQSL